MRITLAAGENKRVGVGGGRFYFEKGLGSIRVKTLGNDSAEFDLKAGMGFQNRADQVNFFGLDIKNNENFTQTIDFVISYREVFDNRVTFGGSAIEVASRKSYVETNNGVAFCRTASKAASASGFGFVLLQGSPTGATVFVSKINYRMAGGSNGVRVSICREFGTLWSDGYQTVTGKETIPLYGCKFSGGGAPMSFIRAGFTAGPLDDDFAGDGWPLYVGEQKETITFDPPIRLDSGHALVIQSLDINTAINVVNLETTEVVV